MNRPITVTIYMMVDEHQNPRKWDMAEWLDSDEVVGWDIKNGHEDCQACENGHKEE